MLKSNVLFITFTLIGCAERQDSPSDVMAAEKDVIWEYNAEGCTADLNHDRVVGEGDYQLFVDHIGEKCTMGNAEGDQDCRDADYNGNMVVDDDDYDLIKSELGCMWNRCEGDLSLDSHVGLHDVELMAREWLRTDCASPDWCGNADIDQDGVVNFFDYAYLSINWGSDCSILGVTYEPSVIDADVNKDGRIDASDAVGFDAYLDAEDPEICAEPDWCQGHDFDHDGTVTLGDWATVAIDYQGRRSETAWCVSDTNNNGEIALDDDGQHVTDGLGQTDCGEPDWCDNADLTRDGVVDVDDHWLIYDHESGGLSCETPPPSEVSGALFADFQLKDGSIPSWVRGELTVALPKTDDGGGGLTHWVSSVRKTATAYIDDDSTLHYTPSRVVTHDTVTIKTRNRYGSTTQSILTIPLAQPTPTASNER